MHILLALDESRHAESIIRWIRRFPHPVGTRLTLVHILEPFDLPEALGATGQCFVQAREAAAEALLSQAMKSLEQPYPHIEAILREGLPIYEILKLIRQVRPNIIVSGTRGLLGAKGLALGSLSQRLLDYAPCSVMLVPSKVGPAKKLKVMLATDGSRGAKGAARLLTILPDIDEVVVLSTVRPVGPRELALGGVEQGESRKARAQILQGRRAAAHKAIEETVNVVRLSGATITTRIVTGHPVEAIPRMAKRDRCDLLVVGSRGLTGMRAMAMGSVSLGVAQSAPCPILVVKPAV